jgi:predicted enzyme related to lactoylglutathione lyase
LARAAAVRALTPPHLAARSQEVVMPIWRRTAVAALSVTAMAGVLPAQEGKMARPSSLGVQANIVFLYYRDVPAAQRFYEDVIGLTLTVDQGFSKIYQVSPTSFIGLVDESQGLHRASEAKAVTVSFVTEQVDQWYAYLQAKGVKMRGPIGDATRHPTRGFVALDPEGYYLEFERFLDHPQNAALLGALKQR